MATRLEDRPFLGHSSDTEILRKNKDIDETRYDDFTSSF